MSFSNVKMFCFWFIGHTKTYSALVKCFTNVACFSGVSKVAEMLNTGMADDNCNMTGWKEFKNRAFLSKANIPFMLLQK